MTLPRTLIVFALATIAGLATAILLSFMAGSLLPQILLHGNGSPHLEPKPGPSEAAGGPQGQALSGEVTARRGNDGIGFATTTPPIVLKGIVRGVSKKDSCAVIEQGRPRVIRPYVIGDRLDRERTLLDIGPDSVTIGQKQQSPAVVRLFSGGPGDPPAMEKGTGTAGGVRQKASNGRRHPSLLPDWTKEVRREGDIVIISRDLAERIRADSNIVMASLAIRIDTDEKGEAHGYRIVSVDKGSLASKMGIAAGDTILEVNGYGLRTADDLQKAYESMQGATHFYVKVLRRGMARTLHYEIR